MLNSQGDGFIYRETQSAFIPWGLNYGNNGRLIEDFWDHEWTTVVDDFKEMRTLGANVVRIHLQFGRFMDSARKPNVQALRKLRKLLGLAEKTGLYLDLTGLACYRPSDRPTWYDDLDDDARWDAQAEFWRAVAAVGHSSSAVFCYDLMNEPIAPAGKAETWYSGKLLGGFDFIQYIARVPQGRSRQEIATAWIDRLTRAIREKDRTHLITVGMLPWVTGWKHLSGFVPREVGPHLDFLSVHIYPKISQPDEASFSLRECAIGKPVVIEETFPLECGVAQLAEFLRSSRTNAAGWLWHYDGKTPAEYEQLERGRRLTISQAIWRDALKSFSKLRTEFVNQEPR